MLHSSGSTRSGGEPVSFDEGEGSMTRIFGRLAAVGACLGVLLLEVLAPQPARASTSITIFGSDIEVLETSDIEYVLRIDGETKIAEERISLDQIDRLAGVDFLIGFAGPGGNACEPAPFIVSFHADGPPKLFGPLETCRPVSIDPEGDVLRLIEVGVPGERVKSWTWSPQGSLSEARYVFPMKKCMGWASL